MPLPKHVDFRMVTGDAFEHTAECNDGTDPIDLSSEEVTMDFYSDDDLVVALTEGDGLTVDGPNGLITIVLTSTQTELLDDGGIKKRYVLRLATSEETILVGRVELFNYVPET